MPFDIKSIFNKNLINVPFSQFVNIITILIYKSILFQNSGRDNLRLIKLISSLLLTYLLSLLIHYYLMMRK